MFRDNSIKGVYGYFQEKLGEQYEKREIENITQLLLQAVFGLSRQDIILADRKFSETELLQLRAIRKRLQQHEPIQHIIGEVDFYGLRLKVGPQALIPRPETEDLVDLVVKTVTAGKFLDIGCGTGAIGLAIKNVLSNAEVDVMDVSEEALHLTAENASLNNLKVNFIQEDILSGSLNKNYDVIVSNPPYIPNSDKAKMNSNVLNYEPALALFVDDESPLIFYERIARLAITNLNTNGFLFYEIHEDYGVEVQSLLQSIGFQDVVVLQDLQGKDRMVKAQKKP